jgi:DNA-binding response OmpR family regulator
MSEPACVLVADDEKALRRLLRLYLGKEGYTVVEAADGLEAIARIRAGGIDVALVDVMLPELDGFEVVRRIRRDSSIPVILITARGEEVNRVAGLELGADDYVVKPFSAPEVVARVRAQLRRVRGFAPADSILLSGEVELDRLERTCRVRGDPVELTRREFDLLAVLLDQAGRVQTREQLLEAAWGTSFLSEKTVDVHVASLRRKLGEAIEINALRGVGYRLERR